MTEDKIGIAFAAVVPKAYSLTTQNKFTGVTQSVIKSKGFETNAACMNYLYFNQVLDMALAASREERLQRYYFPNLQSHEQEISKYILGIS